MLRWFAHHPMLAFTLLYAAAMACGALLGWCRP